jgi:hypothetical protein
VGPSQRGVPTAATIWCDEVGGQASGEAWSVRILVVSSPRSGTHWIKCLLGTIYELEARSGSKKPDATTSKMVQAWAQAGGFHDRWIMRIRGWVRSSRRAPDVVLPEEHGRAPLVFRRIWPSSRMET